MPHKQLPFTTDVQDVQTVNCFHFFQTQETQLQSFISCKPNWCQHNRLSVRVPISKTMQLNAANMPLLRLPPPPASAALRSGAALGPQTKLVPGVSGAGGVVLVSTGMFLLLLDLMLPSSIVLRGWSLAKESHNCS